MTTIITKFSDYEIHPINFFSEKITENLALRDLPGLTNNKIEIINVSKQHPLATLMAAQLQDSRNADPIRSGLLPAISVTPGNAPDSGFTLGKGFEPGIVDDDYIDDLKAYLNKSTKTILEDLIITEKQINLILSAYKKNPLNILYQKNQWRRDEEINVSLWSQSPDLDTLIGTVLDSALSDIQIGFVGDNSKIKNMKIDIVRGLTNFNFGRVIFGIEYNLTFTNTFNNYTIYSETRITDHDANFTYITPGES